MCVCLRVRVYVFVFVGVGVCICVCVGGCVCGYMYVCVSLITCIKYIIKYQNDPGREPFPGTTLEEITEGIKAEEDRRKDGSRRIPVFATETKHVSLPGIFLLI